MPGARRAVVPVLAAALYAPGCDRPSPDAAGVSTDGLPDHDAGRLVARSIDFHDPDRVWGSRPLELAWVGTGADGSERVDVRLRFYEDARRFELEGRYAGSALTYRTSGDDWSATVDGASEPTPEALARMRLDREDGMFWRSYYGFLAGLPMKLRDPGAHLVPEVREATFLGRDVRAVRVTYDPEVGGDTWYFYFDPATAELVGCRFYHDESAGDGEYIAFEGLVEAAGLRLPRHRRWFVNADGRFLGADEIRSLRVGP